MRFSGHTAQGGEATKVKKQEKRLPLSCPVPGGPAAFSRQCLELVTQSHGCLFPWELLMLPSNSFMQWKVTQPQKMKGPWGCLLRESQDNDCQD